MIRIITDSASDLTAAHEAAMNIDIIPMKITFGEEEYRDGVDLTHREFFEKLIETDIFPKTSQINPFEYAKVFQACVGQGDDVVCITLSGTLSGCYQSACIASEEFEGRVYVVDSENAALGERILVELAVRLRDQGLSAKEIAQVLESEKKNICLIALLNTVEYLKKGGRITPAVAAACNLLAIKPVIAIKEGQIELLGKAMGSRTANNKLTEYIKKAGEIDFEKPLVLAYSGLSDELLQKYIRDSEMHYKGHLETLPITDLGATIGSHIGPGAIGLAFFKK